MRRVDLVQRGQRRGQLAVDQLLGQRDALVLGSKVERRRLALLQHLGNDIMQQRALVRVLARRPGRDGRGQRHRTGAVHHALGGRAADDLGVCGHT